MSPWDFDTHDYEDTGLCPDCQEEHHYGDGDFCQSCGYRLYDENGVYWTQWEKDQGQGKDG